MATRIQLSIIALALALLTSMSYGQSLYQRDPEESPGQDDPPFVALLVTTRVARPGSEQVIESHLRALRAASYAGQERTAVYRLKDSETPTYVSVQRLRFLSDTHGSPVDEGYAALTSRLGRLQAAQLDRELRAATTRVSTEVLRVVPEHNAWPLGDADARVIEVRRLAQEPGRFPAAWHPDRWNELRPASELRTQVRHADSVVERITRGFASLADRDAWVASNDGLIEAADDVALLELRPDLSRPAAHFERPPTTTASRGRR